MISVGSRASLRRSAAATASASRPNSAAAEASAQPARDVADVSDVTEGPSLVDGARGEVGEDVVEGGPLADAALQVRRGPARGDAAVVEEGQRVAERVGLLHVVRRQQDG